MPKKNKSPQNLVIKANNNIKTPNINKSNLKINTNKIILIPKTHFPKISANLDNFYYKDYKLNPIAKNNLLNLNCDRNLNYTLKINNYNFPSSNNTIKTFDYKRIFTKPNNWPKEYLNNNNINVRKILFFDNNNKEINNRNSNYRKITKNNSYDSIINKIKYQNNLNQGKIEQMSQKIQKNNIKNNKYNQQKNNIYVNNINKIRIRHYSPENNHEKNKYKNLLNKDNVFYNIIRHNRSNSNSGKKECLNINNKNILREFIEQKKPYIKKTNIHNLIFHQRNLNNIF